MKRRVLVLIATIVVGLAAHAAAGAAAAVRAVHEGQEIPVTAIDSHHCHDLAYPDIRCFDTEIERDIDVVARTAAPATETDAVAATAYTTFYSHANYGGASFTASLSMSNLSNYGWNDQVSSFKSLNGQRPKWWDNAGYVAPSWQWAAGAWLSYVGDSANDRFSSVANVP